MSSFYSKFWCVQKFSSFDTSYWLVQQNDLTALTKTDHMCTLICKSIYQHSKSAIFVMSGFNVYYNGQQYCYTITTIFCLHKFRVPAYVLLLFKILIRNKIIVVLIPLADLCNKIIWPCWPKLSMVALFFINLYTRIVNQPYFFKFLFA